MMKTSETGRLTRWIFTIFILSAFSATALAVPEGEFRYPENNHSFSGNLLFSGRIDDPDGIGNLRLRFNGNSATQILICDNCGSSESFTDAGINPRDYNLNIGSHQAQLVVIKNSSEQILDSVSFSWNPPEVTGIEVERTFGSISINWSGLSGYSLYNLYIASEAEISPNNIDSLPDSITFRSLRGTSQTISGVDDELGLFGLITATDTSGESAYSQVFRIEALDNQDPDVVSETVTVAEDSSISGNVLSNDSDPEGQPLTAELTFEPNNGSVTLTQNGDFQYQPRDNFNGQDSFTYQVNDPQGGSQLGTVNITVTSVNDAPQASSDAYQIAEDTLLNVTAGVGVLANDSDIDGDSLSASVEAEPLNGSLTLSSDGAFSYQPNAHFFGSDSFSYRVSDTGGAFDVQTVSLLITPVNDAPVANDDSYLMDEDSILTITSASEGLLANDSDPDLNADELFNQLTVALLTSPTEGNLQLQNNGTFTFTPAPDFFGDVSFNYQVSDAEGATATASVSIQVNDSPESPIPLDDSYTGNEDEPLVVSAAEGVLANDANISSDTTLSVFSDVQSGVLNLASDGSFVYQPNENFNGADSFSYLVENVLGFAEATVSLEITAVNDAPVVTNDEISTLENTPVIISPLENDSDPDGDTLSVILRNVSSGSASVQGVNIEFVPEADFDGTATITYAASDNNGGETEGSIIITVINANEPPVANDDAVQVDEDNSIIITPLENDNDPDQDPLTLTILSVSSGSATLASPETIEYTPEPNFNGSASISYVISDTEGESDEGLISITINPVNDAPVAEDDEASVAESENITILPLENDSDIDGDELSILDATAVDGTVTFTATTISYTATDSPGSDTISYTIEDPDGETASATITVTITNVQDAPVAEDDTVTTAEDTAVVISPLENDTDEDGDALTVTIDSVTNGSAELASSSTIQFTPEADFVGTATIGYTATDSAGNSDNATITITVTAVNDAPEAIDDSVTVDESGTIVITPLENDIDVDGDDLSITSASAENGTISFTATTISYTAPDSPGTDTISYTISDPDGETASATITVTISNVQDAPVAEDDTVTTAEDTAVVISPLENDTDEDGDSLTVTIDSVTNGSAELASSSTIQFTPEADFVGTATIGYTATDSAGNSDNATITITVTAINDAPEAIDDSVTVDESATIIITPLENDIDVDGDDLSITSASAENGTVTFTATTISYTAPDSPGTDTISYTISDPDGETASATIAITINNIQDPPDAIDDFATTDEDVPIDISPLLNDADEDGDALSLNIDSVSNGSVQLTSSSIVRFTPTVNFFGTAFIEYTATDTAGNSDSAVITITVIAVNDAPNAVNDSATTNEDTPVTVSPLANDSDPENDSLSFVITSTTNGTSVVNSNNSVTFTPLADFNGSAQILYTLSDSGNATDSAIVAITVNAVNDAPVIVNDTAVVNEGETITISPLNNDSDVDGDNLTITSANAENGSATVNTDATAVSYTAPANFSGTDTVSYTVTDGTASVTGSIAVTVNDINQAPVAVNDSFDVFAGETTEIDVLSNDTDADGDTLTIVNASATVGTVTVSSDATFLSYTAPADVTTTDTVTYTINDPSGASASATANISITERPLAGTFDTDGDGNSDISATSDGTNYTLTFGEDVDAVYYEEDGSFVSISANDEGAFELTIEGTVNATKQGKKLGGIKTSGNRDFVLPPAASTIYYTIDGIEYSFTVSNLDEPNANIAFGPPTPLSSGFSGASSYDFYTRQPAFSGPLRFGDENGHHYILSDGGTGAVRGSDFDLDVIWQETNGELDITFIESDEFEEQVNVYHLDDDDSDGIALGVITKSEADAYVAANNTQTITAFLSEARQLIRYIKGNRIFIHAEIDMYYRYRIDSSVYKEITSADTGVIASEPTELLPRQLWNIGTLKLQKISYSDISVGIATEIPWLLNGEFAHFAADFCRFDETSSGAGNGTGYCDISAQSFQWNISNNVLNLDFGNDVSAAYRWLDALSVENTFSVELTVGSGSSADHYSKHVYWLETGGVTDSEITNLLTENYFDNAFSRTNPDARDSDKKIKIEDTFGFYFDANGLAKNITSRTEFDGTSLIDNDRLWEVSGGLVSILSVSTLSSGNAFSYPYDQCAASSDNSCFVWRFRLWQPIVISDNRIWVWETLIANESGPIFDSTSALVDSIRPRIQYYELNSNIPGAPNSISFNQEPIWGNIDFDTEIDTPVSNINLLNNFADPESDALAIIDGDADRGTLSINTDGTLNYTPESNFTGNVNFYLRVSDGINTVYPSGVITVLPQNIAPVANDDNDTALSGIPELLSPLNNDTDANDDQLAISSATPSAGNVTITNNGADLEFIAPATFAGNATISYTVSDGRGGSDSAIITVSVSQPLFRGSYDFDNSDTDDFTITQSGSQFSVEFGGEVTAVYYEENGNTYVVSRNADGSYTFIYDANVSPVPQLKYVVNGVEYSFAPDDLSLTTPNLLYFGNASISNDFVDQTEFLLISRNPTSISALATAFENGATYDLQSNGTGTYSTPSSTDTVDWSIDTDGVLTVGFDNPTSKIIYYSVYDLDDEFNNDGALGVITRAEADAYFAAYNDVFVPVSVTIVGHELDAFNLQGYFYEVNRNFIEVLQIDSSTYPEITSADTGVQIISSRDYVELLDSSRFDFLPIDSSRILGTAYLPVVIEDGSGNFVQFASDECIFAENSAGSNDGTATCSVTGTAGTWAIESDGSVSADFGNSVTAVYRWLDHAQIENTLFVKALDSNGDIYSTLDYWLDSGSPSVSAVSALINGGYLETGDNLTNPFNYDQTGELNDTIGNGYYFDNSGLAKTLSTYFDENNDVVVSDNDLQWQVDTVGNVSLNALSNLSSFDTHRYQYSQCTASDNKLCYIWQRRSWIPLHLDGDRLWVLDYEERDPDNGYYNSSNSIELFEFPKIRFYEPRTDIPGTPESISFNQEPVIISFGYSTSLDTPATFSVLTDISDPENDVITLLDASVSDGSIVINNDDTLTFTPATGFSGTTAMKLIVDDGINQVSLFNFISVTPANTAPVANDDTANAVGSHVHSYDVLDNDTDADNDPLTITNITTLASGFSISSDNLAIEYNAPASLIATETVIYTISDGNGGTDTATLTVSLEPNSDPIVNNDTAGPVLSGNTITITPLDNDSDPDGDSISILNASSSDGVTNVASNGLSFDFTPSISSGTATVTYTASDAFGGSTNGLVEISVTSLNNAPVANNDTANAVGSHTYSYNVLDNDTDADRDLLSITNISTKASGFSISSDNLAIEYNAPASLTATETVTYTISDGNGGTDTATLTVSLVPNSDPIVNNDTAGPVLSGNTITITPLDNDSDPDGDLLTINNATSSDGTTSISGDSLTIDFTPTISSGTATITYTAIDNFGGSATGTISVSVTAVNSAPTDILIDGASSISIARNSTGFNAITGTLATADTDSSDSHTYSLVNVGASALGTCTASGGNGSFSISGNSLRSTALLLPSTYDICVQSSDGSTTFQKTLSITVTNNDPTDILIDGTSSITVVRNNTGFNATMGTLTTTDADSGDSHTYSLVNIGASALGTCTASGGNGNFSISGNSLRSTALLLPSTYDICVQSSDGSTTFQKTLSITVTNNDPTDILIDGISSITVVRNNTGFNATMGTLTTTDADSGDSHTYSLVNIGASALGTCTASGGNGNFSISGNSLRSTVLLLPSTYDICVQSSDGSTTFQKTLSITVTNNDPTDILIEGNASITVIRNNTGFNATMGTLTTTDADSGDSHTYSLVNIGASTLGTCTASGGNGNFSISGNSLRSTALLLPSTYDICVQSSDGSTTFQKTLSITVTNNDPTDILIDGNTSITVIRNNTGFNATMGPLTTTDADSGDSHTYSLVNIGASALGTCTASGGNSNFSVSGNSLRSTALLLPSTYDICVQSSDGSTTFQKTLSITVTNNDPTDILIDGNTSVTIADISTGFNAVMGTLTTTDADSGDSHTYSLVNIGVSVLGTCTASGGNGNFSISSNSLRSTATLSPSTYEVCVQTSDGSTTFQKTLTISVSASNNAPTDILLSSAIIDDNATGTDVVVGSLTTTDVDSGDTHSYSLVSAGSSANGTCSADTGNGSFNINGSDLRTISALSAATYDICVQTSDGSTTFQKSLSVTVNVGNNVPTDILIDGGSSDSVADGVTGTNVVIGALTTTDADGGDSHSYSLVTTGASANGACSDDSGNSSFNINGSDLRSSASLSAANLSVCVETNDGTTTFQKTLSISVTSNSPTPVNDSYTILSQSGFTANINVSAGVMVNDTDPNSDSLTASIVTNPAHASTFSLNADGSFTYKHDGGTTLTDSFVYQVSDGTYTGQATASLTIKPANFVPDICTVPAAYTQAGESYSQIIKVVDNDEDTQTFSISGEPSWLTLNTISDSTATLTGTPTISELGTSTITFTSTDGFDSDSITFDLTVFDEFATSNNTTIEFGGTTEVVYDAVIDNFGNIVIVGTSDGDFAVTRLLRDGTVDSSFNSGNVLTYDFGGANDKAISVKVRPDNGLVVAGQTDSAGTGNEDFAVIALNSDGSFDTAFSGDGIYTIDAGGFSNEDYLAEVLLHDNLDITLIGRSFESGTYKLTAVQLDKTGVIDTSFNNGSPVGLYGFNDVTPEAAIEDDEGNIYIVGHGVNLGSPAAVPDDKHSLNANNTATSDIILTRISVEDGSGNGFAGAVSTVPLFYFDDGGNEYGYDLAFDNEGNVIVAGTKDNDFALYKFTITWDDTNSEWDVALDSTFNGSTGENIIDLGSSSTDFAYSMVSDKRGNYYIAGKQGTDTSIIRISANGVLDTTYGNSGIKTISLSNGVGNTPTIIRTDAMGQLLIFDTEDAGSDAHISITHDTILSTPEFGNCDYVSEFQSSSNKTQDMVVDADMASDNDFFVAGWSVAQDDSNKDFVIIKTDDNGHLDASWGENGYARIDAGASTSITTHEIVALDNKEAVIAGVVSSTDNLYLAKLNAQGELDTSFDSDGIRDFSAAVSLVPKQAIHIASSNKFLIAGEDNSNFYPAVYRFNADGTDDLTFGAGSTVATADAGVNYSVFSDANFSLYDMTVDSSGNIYLVGSYYDTHNQTSVLKFDSDGVIDSSFGGDGLVSIDQSEGHAGISAAISGTNLYILSKRFSDSVVTVLKMATTDGSLDSSFDSDGILVLSDYQVSSSITSSLKIDSNGIIWLQASQSGTSESMLWLDSSGTFSSSFINAGYNLLTPGIDSWTAFAGFQLTNTDAALLYGTRANDFTLASVADNGVVTNIEKNFLFDFGHGEHAVRIALDAYSGPILAGYGRNTSAYDNDMALAKFDNTGNGDNNFGTYGQGETTIELFSPNNESTQFYGFSISANGQFYTTANSVSGSSTSDIYHARIAPLNAALDTLSYGLGLTDLLNSSDDLVANQYLADDGYLYVVGSTDDKGLVYRYDATGSFDSSFNAPNGTIEMSIGSESHLTAITPTSDGKFVAVGYYSNGGDIDGLIIKFSADGTLDTSFSGDGIYEYQVASTEERFFDVAVDGNGIIYATGESGADMLTIALDNSATLAESWNSTGVLTRDINSSSDDVATALLVDAFGAIFILVNSNDEFALLRYNPDGTLISDFGGSRGYSPVNKMRDMAIDSLGNVFITGSTQIDQQWQFFTLRFTNVAGPY